MVAGCLERRSGRQRVQRFRRAAAEVAADFGGDDYDFTLAGNKRRVADAAAKAREEGVAIGREEGREEGVAIGRQAERQEILQQMADWYQSAKEEMAAGYEPDPPPIFGENGNKTG